MRPSIVVSIRHGWRYRARPYGAAILASLLVMLGGGGCGSDSPSYSLTRIEPSDLVQRVTAAGKLEVAAPVDVLAPASGPLASVCVREGDVVAEGQILAIMDAAYLQARADDAKADYLTVASLGEAQRGIFTALGGLSAGLAQGSEQLAGFQTQVDLLALTFFDLGPVLVPMLPPGQQADALARLQQAQQRYLEAAANRPAGGVAPVAVSGGGGAAADSARKANAQRDYQKALDAVANAEIRAPAGGTVIFAPQAGLLSTDFIASFSASLEGLSGGLTLLGGSSGGALALTDMLNSLQPQLELKAGMNVSGGKPVFQVVDLHDMAVRASIEETDIAQLEQGQEAEIRLDALPDLVLAGRVVQVGVKAKTGEAGTSVFDVLIRLDRADTALRIGYNGTVDVVVLDRADVLAVPSSALLRSEGRSYLWVKTGGRAERREVRTGMTTGDAVEIISGLQDGETIVSEGAGSIREGQELD